MVDSRQTPIVAFLDEVQVALAAGKGGAGCLSFHRAKYLPRGGPDGGDGGKGGDVYLVARSRLNTFEDALGGRRRFEAGKGQPGLSGNKHGKNGADLHFELPVGTIVRDVERGHVLSELAEPDQSVLILKGGKGGRGNMSFKSARRQAPRIAQTGLPGEERKVRLELKILADVGLVGLPNAGKSTLLSAISAARPKVGHYPFTTLKPRLGTVEYDFETLTVADLPGLLEGAHGGRGLGDRFLRHIERTRVLLHLVDASEGDLEEWEASYRTVREELVAYGGSIEQKPEVVLLTKTALRTTPVNAAELGARIGRTVLPISSTEGEGLEPLVVTLFDLLRRRGGGAAGTA